MARNKEPVTDEELAEFQEAMEAQREEIREALAEDLGGEPEDYDVEKYLNDRADGPIADGGDGSED